MKNDNKNVLNNNVLDTKNKDKTRSIVDNLDNIGFLVEKIEAFNRLIYIKLEEVNDSPTKLYNGNNTTNNIVSELFTIKSNINDYIMLNYSITDYTTRINTLLNDIQDKLRQ